MYPPDSPFHLHKFAWTIWFAVKKHFSAVALDLPCRSLFHDDISVKDLLLLPLRNKTFWVFGMSVLLELTIFMAIGCKSTFTYITVSYPCQATSSGRGIWTPNLLVMSQASFRIALSRDITGHSRGRSYNPLVNSQVLCQLSYVSKIVEQDAPPLFEY